jgi:Zn-dependent oligopeptidase
MNFNAMEKKITELSAKVDRLLRQKEQENKIKDVILKYEKDEKYLVSVWLLLGLKNSAQPGSTFFEDYHRIVKKISVGTIKGLFTKPGALRVLVIQRYEKFLAINNIEPPKEYFEYYEKCE